MEAEGKGHRNCFNIEQPSLTNVYDASHLDSSIVGIFILNCSIVKGTTSSF